MKISQNQTMLMFFILTALVPIMAVDMSKGLTYAPGGIALIFLAIHYFIFKTKFILTRSTLIFVISVLALSAASLLWADHFDESLSKVEKLALLLPPQVLLISFALSLRHDQIAPYIHIFSYGVIGASVLYCFEMLSGGVIYNLFRGAPLFEKVSPHEFNVAAVVLALYSFMAMAILKQSKKPAFLYGALWGVLLIALTITESQSAQLAFIVGAVFLFAFPYRSKWAWAGLKGIILTLMLVAPFLAIYLYQNFAPAIENLPMMGRAFAGHRLEIWDYVSRFMLENPLVGHGIEVTRATVFDSKQIFSNTNTTLHPHNFAVQIWVEFGLVGILIAMFFMYKLLTLIQNNFSEQQQRFILPTLMATLVPASFAFGLWQGWWTAIFFHLAAMSIMICKVTGDEQKAKTGPDDAASQ